MLLPMPITDEQAKAVTATAELGKTALEEGGKFVRAISKIFGTIPEDVAGLVIGDHLRLLRTKNILKNFDQVTEILSRRGVKHTEGVSPSIAVPLLSAASDETRPELQKIWSELIAAAMDPARSNRVRLSFINTVKQFDPLDALLLFERVSISGGLSPDGAEFMSKRLQKSINEIYVSVDNLKRLNCLVTPTYDLNNFSPSHIGLEIVRACSDQ